MKIVCITGMVTAELKHAEQLLNMAGMGQPRPAKNTTVPDLMKWHEYAASNLLPNSFSMPGRRWQRMLDDIFEENIDNSFWGWQHPFSIRFLDFWKEFEPQLHFIILFSSPQHALASCLEFPLSGDANQALRHWINSHIQVLRFVNENSDHCLLLNAADYATQPAVILEECRNHWNLPLKDIQTVSCPVPNRVALKLGELYARQSTQAMEVFEQLQNCPYRLFIANKEHTSIANATQNASEDFASLMTSFKELMDPPVIAATQNELKRLLHRYDTSQKELTDTKLKRDELSQHAHNLQREWDNAKIKIADLENENTLALNQMYMVQEELERLFFKNQRNLLRANDLESRWQRFLSRNPDYNVCERYERVFDSTNKSCTWTLYNFDDGERFFENLQVKTICHEKTAGFIFSYQDGESPLFRWPLPEKGENAFLLILPTTDPQLENFAHSVLENLSPSDWRMIRMLTVFFICALEQEKTQSSTCEDLFKLLDSLYIMQNRLDDVDTSLRFDEVELISEEKDDNYECLQLRMQNIVLADKHISELEFYLACAKPDGRFGEHPRLEFPEESKVVMESWFEESENQHGPKLELRFAMPNAMDMDVWNSLSDSDQRLIQALIEKLPYTLDMLDTTNTSMEYKDQWCEICVYMNKVLQNYLLRIQSTDTVDSNDNTVTTNSSDMYIDPSKSICNDHKNICKG